MRKLEIESSLSQYEGIQNVVSNAVREDDKPHNAEIAAIEIEKKSIEFIPEHDTRIYIFSRDKEFISLPG
jgi:hypothetical protein